MSFFWTSYWSTTLTLPDHQCFCNPSKISWTIWLFFRNFCDEAWLFVLSRLFGLLSSSLLLYSQRFGRSALRPSSGPSCRLRQEGSQVWKEGSRVRKESSRVRQEAPEEGRRADRPKRCEYNNKDEDNSPNNLDNTSSYCTLINCIIIFCITNVFGYFCGFMA